MKKNMGMADRVIRVIIAALVVVLYLTNVLTGIWGIVLLMLAGVLVLTSLMGFCPIYTIFGINTCATDKKTTRVVH